MRKTYLASVKDDILKDQYKGTIHLLCGGEWELVACVYGKTLQQMRFRKHRLTDALNGFNPEAGKWNATRKEKRT